MKKLKTALSLALLIAAKVPAADDACAKLSRADRGAIDSVFKYVSSVPGPHEDAIWGPQSKFENPGSVASCVWSVLDRCEGGESRTPNCGEWRLERASALFWQLNTIQPPCNFVRDAAPVLARGRHRLLRAKLCAAYVMAGGNAQCLATDKDIFAREYRRGYREHDPKSDDWLYSLLFSAPAPAYSSLLPWLEALPSRFNTRSPNNNFMGWAKAVAIASHRRDLDGFLKLMRDSRGFDQFISPWLVHYFPDKDWPAKLDRFRFDPKRRAQILDSIAFSKRVPVETDIIRWADAHHCKASPS